MMPGANETEGRIGDAEHRERRPSDVDEAAVERVAHEVGAGCAAELALDVRAVRLDRPHAEEELLPISALVCPRAMRRRTSTSRWLRSSGASMEAVGSAAMRAPSCGLR